MQVQGVTPCLRDAIWSGGETMRVGVWQRCGFVARTHRAAGFFGVGSTLAAREGLAAFAPSLPLCCVAPWAAAVHPAALAGARPGLPRAPRTPRAWSTSGPARGCSDPTAIASSIDRPGLAGLAMQRRESRC